MKKIILTKGLPASGKTTFAKEILAKEPGKWKRINKDELRVMLDAGKWSKQNEEFVLEQRDFMAMAALIHGYNVIIDDTNLHPKHETRMRELAKTWSNTILPKPEPVEVEIKDFTDIPLEECIKRDQQRPNYVGEKVIRQMWNQFLKPQLPKIEHNPELPKAIICDLDGTLALFGDRNPYDREFISDEVNMAVKTVLDAIHESGFDNILLVSGRKNKYFQETQKWLDKNKIFYDKLFMPRADNDNRKDVIIKNEIYEAEIKDKYNVYFIMDDRQQVINFWRSLGLTVFQVADGDF